MTLYLQNFVKYFSSSSSSSFGILVKKLGLNELKFYMTSGTFFLSQNRKCSGFDYPLSVLKIKPLYLS